MSTTDLFLSKCLFNMISQRQSYRPMFSSYTASQRLYFYTFVLFCHKLICCVNWDRKMKANWCHFLKYIFNLKKKKLWGGVWQNLEFGVRSLYLWKNKKIGGPYVICSGRQRLPKSHKIIVWQWHSKSKALNQDKYGQASTRDHFQLCHNSLISYLRVNILPKSPMFPITLNSVLRTFASETWR